MLQGERKIVGPGLDKGSQKDRDKDQQDTRTYEDRVDRKSPLLQRPGRLDERPGLAADHCIAFSCQVVIDRKSGDGGDQQDHADRRPEVEALHAEDLVDDLRRQNRIVAPDDDRNSEVRDGQIEAERRRAGDSIFRRRERHLEKGFHGRCPQALCGFIQPRIHGRKGRIEDEKRIGETVEYLSHNDARRAVNIPARIQQVTCDHAVPPEEQDERQGLDDGRRDQRKCRDHVKESLAGHGRAGQAVGEQEGQHRRDDHRHNGDIHAVVKGFVYPGFGKKIEIVLQGKKPIPDKAQPADIDHRIEQKDRQDDQQKNRDHPGEEVVGGKP